MTLFWTLVIILVMGIIMAVFTVLCGYEYVRAASYASGGRKIIQQLEDEYDAIISRKLLAYGHLPIRDEEP